ADKPDPARKWKLGIIKGSVTGSQPEVRKNFEESVKVLRQICDIEDGVSLPDLPFGPAVSTIINAETASAFRDFIDSGGPRTLRSVHDRFGGYAGMTILAVDYLQAMRVRGRMKKAMDELYAKYDALIAPSRNTVSYPISIDFDKAYPGIEGPPIIP